MKRFSLADMLLVGCRCSEGNFGCGHRRRTSTMGIHDHGNSGFHHRYVVALDILASASAIIALRRLRRKRASSR